MVETMVEAREIITDIKDKTANPTPLGFTGLQYFTNWIRKSSIPITISNI